MRECHNRHIFYILTQLRMCFMSSIMCGLEMRNKSDVFIKVISVFVVCGVRETPGVERDEEEGMDEKPHDVVEYF